MSRHLERALYKYSITSHNVFHCTYMCMQYVRISCYTIYYTVTGQYLMRNEICYKILVLYEFIHSSIHSGYFYSVSSSPLLLRGTTDAARILCWSFTPKRHRQLRVKDLPKARTWWLERDSNPRPFGRKASNVPMIHKSPQYLI